MSDAFVREALRTLEMEPLAGLAKRNKFYTGDVNDGSTTYFLKASRSDVPNTVFGDLENEVAWDKFVNPQLPDDGPFVVPAVVAVDPKNKWALFEHLDGELVKEGDLPYQIGRLSLLATTILGLSLGREPADLAEWYTTRLGRFTKSVETLGGPTELNKFQAIRGGVVDLSALIPGIIHGDLNLKNVLQSGDAQLGLVDAEFGTTPNKPEWDKPRYHDVAYFYHLLVCQYQNPDLAAQFLDDTMQGLRAAGGFNEQTFEREFNLSLLERTVSMANHFVLNRDPNKTIDDDRRSKPEPYKALIKNSLSVLTA